MTLYPETEILADNGYSLATNSILFAVLSDHVNEDEVTITFDDLNRKRLQFWNSGKHTYFSFTEGELPRIIRERYSSFISPAPKINNKDAWKVDLRWLGEAVDQFNETELMFCLYSEELARRFHLFCSLGIDLRIFDPPFHGVTCVLHCMFFFNEVDLSHTTQLFNIAKELKPDGTNREWFKMIYQLEELEWEWKKQITEITPELRKKILGQIKKIEVPSDL